MFSKSPWIWFFLMTRWHHDTGHVHRRGTLLYARKSTRRCMYSCRFATPAATSCSYAATASHLTSLDNLTHTALSLVVSLGHCPHASEDVQKDLWNKHVLVHLHPSARPWRWSWIDPRKFGGHGSVQITWSPHGQDWRDLTSLIPLPIPS
jgi:hypothetical protein